jgi:hypothetical protein
VSVREKLIKEVHGGDRHEASASALAGSYYSS